MRRLILGFALVAPLLTVATWSRSIPLAIGILFASHMLVLYPTLRPSSQWLGPVVTRFRTAKNEVWLTIDDGPAPDTPAVLDILDRHGAKATFFVKGTCVLEKPELARAIVERGHTLGNHSHTHPAGRFWRLSPGAIEGEIRGCNHAIRSLFDASPHLFRAPVGMKNPFVHPVLDRLGMRLVAWSSRGFDGIDGFDADAVVARIVRDAAPGAIILCHQGATGANGTTNAQCLERLLTELDRRGLRCVIPEQATLIC